MPWRLRAPARSLPGHQGLRREGSACRRKHRLASRAAMELSRMRCRFNVQRRPWLGETSRHRPLRRTAIPIDRMADRKPFAAGPLAARDGHNFAVDSRQAPAPAAHPSPGRRVPKRYQRRPERPRRLGVSAFSGWAADDLAAPIPRIPRLIMNARVLELPSVNQHRFPCGRCGLGD
jgi:hypothetical protein